jgi:hypothetical protein
MKTLTAKIDKKQSKAKGQQSKTLEILKGNKNFDLKDIFDPLDTFPSSHLKGYDCGGKKVKAFDFIACLDKTKKSPKVDFVEQADANCQDWAYGGYVIDTPLTQAWKGLEKALLKTIKSLDNKITLNHKDVSITINPKGGQYLDTTSEDRSKYYPTFEIKDLTTGDSVSYEYFQLSAQDRSMIALDLIEELQ